MREKSAMSWKEARDEARLRGSNNEDVDMIGMVENGQESDVRFHT